MYVHIYRHGEPDAEGMHLEVPRITFFQDGHRFGHDEPVMVLGVRPNITTIRLRDIRWYWVEDN